MGNSQAKNNKKAVAAALASADTPASELYPLAVNETNLETKEELYSRAAKAYLEEGDHSSAALAYSRAGEVNVQLKEWADAGDSYIEAMMAYSLFGTQYFDEFEESIDKAMEFAKRSEYKTRQKACADKIGQAILRMMTSCKTGDVITLLIKSQLVAVYLKGDQFTNGLKIMVERFKDSDTKKNYGVWALVFQSAVDFFVGQFALDGSFDDDICTYAVMAILCAHLHQWDIETGVAKIDNASPKGGKMNKKKVNDDGDENDDDGNDDDDDTNTLTYPTPAQLQQKFMIINAYKRSAHQFVHNTMCAADCGDLEAVDEQFREVYVVRRKNKYRLVEYLCDDVYKNKFEDWVKEKKITVKVWQETPPPGEGGSDEGGHDAVDHLL